MAHRLRWLLVASLTLAVVACRRDGPPPAADSQVTTLGQGGEGGQGARDAEELRMLTDAELTPAIIGKAQQVLKQYREQRLGYEVPFDLEGKRYVARLEEHYHPPGSGEQPVGEHLGVTVYVLE